MVALFFWMFVCHIKKRLQHLIILQIHYFTGVNILTHCIIQMNVSDGLLHYVNKAIDTALWPFPLQPRILSASLPLCLLIEILYILSPLPHPSSLALKFSCLNMSSSTIMLFANHYGKGDVYIITSRLGIRAQPQLSPAHVQLNNGSFLELPL